MEAEEEEPEKWSWKVDMGWREVDGKLMKMEIVSDEGSGLSCPYPYEGTVPFSLFICLFPFLEPPSGLGQCLAHLCVPVRGPVPCA